MTDRATRVHLIDRSALFDQTHDMPEPRAVTIRATVLHAVANSGVAAPSGSALGCAARVRPFLRDLEHGTTRYLGPDRYDMHVDRAAIEVSQVGDGFVLTSETYTRA